MTPVVRSTRFGDPLRRSFLDELRRRVLLPRPLAAEWAEMRAELTIAVIDDGGPTLVLAAGTLDGDRRWLLRQPLDDFETGDLVDVRRHEFEVAGHTPGGAHARAGEDVARLVDAVADALDQVALLRPEQASIPRELASSIRAARASAVQARDEDEPEDEDEDEEDEEEHEKDEHEDEDGPAERAVDTPPRGPSRTVRLIRDTGVALAVAGAALGAGVLVWTATSADGTTDAGAEAEAAGAATPDPTAAAGVAPDFTVQTRNPDGSAVRFDPCRSYEYVVQPGSLAPEEAAAEVGAAFAALEEASGVAFRFSGFSESRFPEPVDPQNLPGLPILVSYETADESPSLQEGRHAYGGEAGQPLGGLALGKPVAARADLTVIAGGALVIDSGLTAEQRARILLHELGHLAGLGHAVDPGQMMAPTVPGDGPLVYRDGDRAGLRELGAAGGCALTDAERAAVFG